MPFDASISHSWPAARPLVKWTGGKSAELDTIRRAIPGGIGRHIEPFVGGGAVMFALPSTIPAEVNDRSPDLIALYRHLAADCSTFLSAIRAVDEAWSALDLLDVSQPSERMAEKAASVGALLVAFLGPGFPDQVAEATLRALNRKGRFLDRLRERGEEKGTPDGLMMAALKGGLYTALRTTFNARPHGPVRAALFWFLREYCYGGMFRTNASGGFNVPYGGISYNGRSMKARFEQLQAPELVARLASARFHCGDFEAFIDTVRPRPDDFVFLDPPYDSPFSTYDGNAFSRDDHRRLAARMASMEARWMLVISETDFVRETYCSLPGARVEAFGKLYRGNIKNRVDGRATHLLITNYDPDARGIDPCPYAGATAYHWNAGEHHGQRCR